MTRPAPAPPTACDDRDHRADRAAIAQIISDIETGLNRKNPDLMTRHFAENAIAVGVDGSAVTGRDALRAAHVRGLSGFLRDQYARYEIADLTFPPSRRRDPAQARPRYRPGRDATGRRSRHDRAVRPDEGAGPVVDRGAPEHARADLNGRPGDT